MLCKIEQEKESSKYKGTSISVVCRQREFNKSKRKVWVVCCHDLRFKPNITSKGCLSYDEMDQTL